VASLKRLKWVITARDATRGAFASITRRIDKLKTSFGKLRTAAAGALAAIGAGIAAAGAVGEANEVLRIAKAYNSTTKEVDGLFQAFVEGGSDAARASIMVEKMALGAREAALDPGGEVAGFFRQFDLNPNQLNRVKLLVDFVDTLKKRGPGARTDIASRLFAEESIGAARQVGANLPQGVRGFTAQADVEGKLLGPGVAEENRKIRSASLSIIKQGQRFFQTGLATMSIMGRGIVAMTSGQGGTIGGGMSQIQNEMLSLDVGQKIVTELSKISTNTKNSGVLGN